MLKKMMGTLILLLGLMVGSVCQAGLYDNPTVAIMPFQNKVPDRWDGFGNHAGIATEELITLISDRPDVFQVYERIELQDLVDEQSLGMTGLIAEDTAAEVGNLSGVEYKIFGALTNLSAKEDSFGLAGLTGGLIGSQASVVANVSIRVVEVSTGRVVLVGQGRARAARSAYRAAWPQRAVHSCSAPRTSPTRWHSTPSPRRSRMPSTAKRDSLRRWASTTKRERNVKESLIK